jgi:ubiquinone/menaquinone biosynthesis C-methylase UbiE
MRSMGEEMTDCSCVRVFAWEESYKRRENFVFYPNDEVVRFVARHLRRRVGLDDVVDVLAGANGSKVVDIGCGIGRNLVFGHEMGLDMHGIDLSQNAVDVARDWLSRRGVTDVVERVRAGDIQQLPWPTGYFDHAMSDSVLDSMPFDVARAGVLEIARVMQSGGYFYCNLISGDETGRSADFCGEVVVEAQHERDTIQSYFNREKIDCLLNGEFEILSYALHQIREDGGQRIGRWHVIARHR